MTRHVPHRGVLTPQLAQGGDGNGSSPGGRQSAETAYLNNRRFERAVERPVNTTWQLAVRAGNHANRQNQAKYAPLAPRPGGLPPNPANGPGARSYLLGQMRVTRTKAARWGTRIKPVGYTGVPTNICVFY